MSQMQEPEEQAYGEGYRVTPEQSTYESKQQPYEEAEQSGLGAAYAAYKGYSQKILPSSGGANLPLAVVSLVFSSLIMGVAITLLSLSIVILSGTAPTQTLFAEVLTSCILSICLLAFTIAAFVFSLVQFILIAKKSPSLRRRRASRLRNNNYSS